ncbi:MAG: hypothetical protein O7C75_13400 [Verrucomicrobia bacterium]|nr:hypothetical protein [Verrucomicrobiota bacterium]
MKNSNVKMGTMRKMMFRIIPDCEEATHRSWLSLCHLYMNRRQRFGHRLHLLVCRECSNYAKTLDWVNETLKVVPDAPQFDISYKIRPEFKKEIRKAIEARLQGESDGRTN